MRRAVAMFVGMLWLMGNAQGQPRMERGDAPQFMFFEPVNLVSADPGKSRLDIPYRIDEGFFIPVRNTDTSFRWSFKKQGEVMMELLDSTETSVARDINRIEIGAESSEETYETKQWYQNIVTFNVPPGRYKLIIEVDDLESERKFLSDNTPVIARAFGTSTLDASTPLFIEWDDSSSTAERITLQNWGRDLQFGKKAALFFELSAKEPTDQPVSVMYGISVMNRPDDPPRQVASDTVEDAILLRNIRLTPARSGESVGYEVATADPGHGTGVIVPIHAEKLPLRSFELAVTVKQGTAMTTVKKTFGMVWPDMPLSLRDVDYALEALRYVTTEQQRDSLARGSAVERRDNLERFWQSKDKTPETAFNEVQAEYYKRVDHARRAFSTLREPDGSLTDRGRIYILFGQPAKIDRALDPASGFQEEWVYENLNKRFIFADKSKSGNYILVSSQTL